MREGRRWPECYPEGTRLICVKRGLRRREIPSVSSGPRLQKGGYMNDEFTTRSGHKIRLVAIPYVNVFKIRKQVYTDFEARGEPITPPTYEIKLYTGDTETIAHDEKSLKTDEDRKAWNEYRQALRRLQIEQNRKAGEYIFRRGIMVDSEAIEAWAIQQKKWKLDVPEDEEEQREAYLNDVLADPRDLKEVSTVIMRLSFQGHISEEAISAAEAMF